VLAPGGGGAGALPLITGPVERVRVFGVDRGFRIAVGQGGALRITDIDRDGVRLDDDLGRRVLDRTGRLGMAVVLGAVVACLLGALRFSADAAQALRALGVVAPLVAAALLVGLRAAFG